MADATQTAGFQVMETTAITKKFRAQDRIFYLMTLGSAALVVLVLLAILTVLVIDAFANLSDLRAFVPLGHEVERSHRNLWCCPCRGRYAGEFADRDGDCCSPEHRYRHLPHGTLPRQPATSDQHGYRAPGRCSLDYLRHRWSVHSRATDADLCFALPYDDARSGAVDRPAVPAAGTGRRPIDGKPRAGMGRASRRCSG